MISASDVEARVGKPCPGFVRFWIYFVKFSLRALEIPLLKIDSISSKSILAILANVSHWSLIVNFKFNGIPQQPTKTKSNDSNKNVTLAAFKETQNIEIASRTIKNEAEIKLARIGEILDPNFRKKSPVNGPNFLSRGIFLFLNGFS